MDLSLKKLVPINSKHLLPIARRFWFVANAHTIAIWLAKNEDEHGITFVLATARS